MVLVNCSYQPDVDDPFTELLKHIERSWQGPFRAPRTGLSRDQQRAEGQTAIQYQPYFTSLLNRKLREKVYKVKRHHDGIRLSIGISTSYRLDICKTKGWRMAMAWFYDSMVLRRYGTLKIQKISLFI